MRMAESLTECQYSKPRDIAKKLDLQFQEAS